MNIDLTEKWAKEIALMTDGEFAENCKYIEMLIDKRKAVLPQAVVIKSACEKCKPMVNAEWTKLVCTECGIEYLPSRTVL